MTISSTNATDSYTGDGSTTSFPTTFVFSTSADIEVVERVIATGVETTKTLTTDYTVTGGGGAGAVPATGTVVAVTAPANTVTWTLRRVVAETQATALPVAGSLPSTAVELGLDRLTMQVQQHSEEFSRSLSFPKTDADTLDPTIPSSVDRASKLLAFTSDGTPTVRDLVDGGSGTMSDLVDDETPQLGGTLDTNGKQVRWSKGADVASATALTLGTDGNYFDVTGTTTITSIGALAVGTVVRLHFDGALTLTHHATNLILPGGANITTAAGDEFTFAEYASGDWRCVGYALASGESVIPSTNVGVQAFTSSGTYTPTSGMRFCLAFVTGAGGGGGGSGTTSNRSGGGGGAGGTAIRLLTAAQIGASQTVTIGAAGAAGTASGDGGTGGNTTLGALATGNGGEGGTVGGPGVSDMGEGGTASSGDLNITGGGGRERSFNDAESGPGGASFWGGGHGGRISNTAGGAGLAYGSGGSAGVTSDVTGSAGGAGAVGVVFIVEFF